MWEKIAIDLFDFCDLWRFIAIFCDFSLSSGPQKNHVCIWVLAHRCAAFAVANSRLTPLMAHHNLLLVAPTFARVFIINH